MCTRVCKLLIKVPEALLPVGCPSNTSSLIQQFDAIEVQHQRIGHEESPLSFPSALEFLAGFNTEDQGASFRVAHSHTDVFGWTEDARVINTFATRKYEQTWHVAGNYGSNTHAKHGVGMLTVQTVHVEHSLWSRPESVRVRRSWALVLLMGRAWHTETEFYKNTKHWMWQNTVVHLCKKNKKHLAVALTVKNCGAGTPCPHMSGSQTLYGASNHHSKHTCSHWQRWHISLKQ